MAVGEKTLDQFTGTAQRPTPFTLYFLRNPDLASPQSRKQALRHLYEAVYDALAVESATVADPTALSPTDGQQWIVAESAAGAWNTHDNELAIWDDNASAWVFATPSEGWRFYSKAQDQIYIFDGTDWLVSLTIPALSGKKAHRLRVNAAENNVEFAPGPKAGATTIADTNSSVSVSFATAFADANYAVSLTAHADEPVWISNKAAGGFDINRGNSSGSDDVDWIAVPHEDL